MATNSEAFDSYLLRGVLVMAGIAIIYATLDDPHPAATGTFVIFFLCGGIIAAASPTRWSVDTTLRIFQGIPLLVGFSLVANGIYYLFSFDLPTYTAVLFGWGFLSITGFVLVPWSEVRTYLERVNDPEADVDGPVAPLPRRLLVQLQYAVSGLLILTVAVIAFRLFGLTDFGQTMVIGSVGFAGLVNVRCSPFSGSPERIVRRRQLRWIVLAVGIGASSLYGFLWTDARSWVVIWAAVALGIGYWLLRTDWDEVRYSIAETQANTRTDWE